MVKRTDKRKEFYNRKARHEYSIEDSFEAGIVLTGQEIKAVRNGRVDMSSSYVKLINGEVFWLGGVINGLEVEKQRTRKLLLHKKEIKRLIGKTTEKGLTLIPLKLYFKKGKLKMEVGLGKGMKKYEKREVLKKRDIQREVEIGLKDGKSR